MHHPVVHKIQQGFTLVELVIVITLTGVVAVLASTIVGNQVLGYVDMSRRAALTAKADMALQLMARELRSAVPYSIRVTGGSAIEWVPVLSWGRYRKLVNAVQTDTLDFSAPDDQFEVLYANALPVLPASARMVVGNTSSNGVDGVNIYGGAGTGVLVPAGSHVITPASTTLSLLGNNIQFSASHQFSLASLASRFYLVNNATSYVCNAGTITRYEGYNIQATQPTNGAAAPLSSAASAVLLENVTGCSFGYTAIDTSHGLVTLTIQIEQDGESVTLYHVVNVENRP